MKSSVHKSQSTFDNFHPTKTVRFVRLFCFLSLSFFLIAGAQIARNNEIEKERLMVTPLHLICFQTCHTGLSHAAGPWRAVRPWCLAEPGVSSLPVFVCL